MGRSNIPLFQGEAFHNQHTFHPAPSQCHERQQYSRWWETPSACGLSEDSVAQSLHQHKMHMGYEQDINLCGF